ncbi:MAG: PEP-CTERM sorting domain-containing protein [Rariglobus sp.]|nr:PEP-CTERM sorting domain-containing protein [Rariglobus sp.]
MRKVISACLPALCLVCLPLSAQVLQIDFGPTVATGTDQTNSPYHTANGSFTDTVWNQVQTADIAAGSLVWSDGTTATGVSANLGATTTAVSTTIGLTSQPSTSGALGGTTSAGIYAGTSVGTDGIFTGGGGNTRAVGVQIGGLSAGTYDIYIAARNTSLSANLTQNLYVGKSATAANYDFSTYSSQTLTYASASASTSAWQSGINYSVFSITLSSGEFLNIATIGVSERGVLNSIQIVTAIPEPSTYALFAGIALFALCFGRRLRASRAR